MSRPHRRRLPFVIAALPVVLTSAVRASHIAWFYALEEDRVAFEKLAGQPLRSATQCSVTIHHYQVGAHKVCAVRMGSGCTVTANAAATCLTLFPADRVISTGPAGSLDATTRTGTWHRAERIVAWQKGQAAEGGRILAGPAAASECPPPADTWPQGELPPVPPPGPGSGATFPPPRAPRRPPPPPPPPPRGGAKGACPPWAAAPARPAPPQAKSRPRQTPGVKANAPRFPPRAWLPAKRSSPPPASATPSPATPAASWWK